MRCVLLYWLCCYWGWLWCCGGGREFCAGEVDLTVGGAGEDVGSTCGGEGQAVYGGCVCLDCVERDHRENWRGWHGWMPGNKPEQRRKVMGNLQLMTAWDLRVFWYNRDLDQKSGGSAHMVCRVSYCLEDNQCSYCSFASHEYRNIAILLEKTR